MRRDPPCALAQESLDRSLERLRSRLGEEDADLETLTDAFLTIQRILCRKMFQIGKAPEE